MFSHCARHNGNKQLPLRNSLLLNTIVCNEDRCVASNYLWRLQLSAANCDAAENPTNYAVAAPPHHPKNFLFTPLITLGHRTAKLLVRAMWSPPYVYYFLVLSSKPVLIIQVLVFPFSLDHFKLLNNYWEKIRNKFPQVVDKLMLIQ